MLLEIAHILLRAFRGMDAASGVRRRSLSFTLYSIPRNLFARQRVFRWFSSVLLHRLLHILSIIIRGIAKVQDLVKIVCRSFESSRRAWGGVRQVWGGVFLSKCVHWCCSVLTA